MGDRVRKQGGRMKKAMSIVKGLLYLIAIELFIHAVAYTIGRGIGDGLISSLNDNQKIAIFQLDK